MARVFIVDRWLKNDENGNPPTAAMKRSLANAKDPMKAKVPAEHRSIYGQSTTAGDAAGTPRRRA